MGLVIARSNPTKIASCIQPEFMMSLSKRPPPPPSGSDLATYSAAGQPAAFLQISTKLKTFPGEASPQTSRSKAQMKRRQPECSQP
jgi:hypothetical protein